MSELKTQKSEQSVEAFLNSVEDENRRQDGFTILELMRRVTGLEPRMWGSAIIGFGDLHYKYASGREGDWFVTGFSPRKQNMTLYFNCSLDAEPELMARLGKHKTGVGCLYLNRLSQVDLDALEELIRRNFERDPDLLKK